MKYCLISFVLVFSCYVSYSQRIQVIGYYSGQAAGVDEIPAEKLTQIIFSFCHLKGDHLHVDSPADSTTITKLVALKKRNANLKIVLSLGGWGGCEPCSGAFSSADGRSQFAKSVLMLSQRYHIDGLDLDWEYPAIEGYPGHAYTPADRSNFTELIKTLRKELGPKFELSFAAGGFKKFLDESVDWKQVMPLVDRVNLMTYDLVNGYSQTTGHHTPLYASGKTTEATDFAVQYLSKLGVPKNKMVIGAAFYARMWENVPAENHGLYQSGKFKSSVDYRSIVSELTPEKGFEYFWDDATKAPYVYNAKEKLFATYDDKKSIAAKTKYSIDQGLQGIMFWELTLDNYSNGLLAEIDRIAKAK